MLSHTHPSAHGFTLVELILVLLLIGVLGAVAAPRMFRVADFAAVGARQQTLAVLRYAQKTAIAQRRTVCVAVNANGLALTMDAAVPPAGVCGAALALPFAAPAPVGMNATVGVAAINAFGFLPLGSTDQPGAITIAIAGAAPVTVGAETGYVR